MTSLYHITKEHLHEEYKVLQELAMSPDCLSIGNPMDIAAREPLNIAKNRYWNVLARDSTRVKLEEYACTDYINANFVHSDKTTYILAQAPLQSTLGDFWEMIWENNVYVTTMLTKEIEKGCIKADRYWPEHGQTKEYGSITVTATSGLSLDNDQILVRSFLLRKGLETRQAVQLHYREWPDFGVPSSTQTTLNLLRLIDYFAKEGEKLFSVKTPLLMHCSAGLGRTGTFCAIHMALEKLERGDVPYVKDLVNYIRTCRPGSVQTVDQYGFIFNVLHSYVMQQQQGSDAPVQQLTKRTRRPFALSDSHVTFETKCSDCAIHSSCRRCLSRSMELLRTPNIVTVPN